MRILVVSLITLLLTVAVSGQRPERSVRAAILVHSSIDNVWKAWTTEAGIRSFFAPDCKIEAQVGGQYEIYFNPTGEAGQRGAEGTKILALQPSRMLAFSWNNPPTIPQLRWQYTSVVVKLKRVSSNLTRVSLYHTGWGDGKVWDDAFKYFSEAR
jgi:uncharacterized protein YndB with AHSA1/START domain